MTTTLITGATSGIGLALARLYAARGHTLLLLGRKAPADLDSAFFTPARYIQADLAQPQPEATVTAQLAERGITQLDMLVHNAGVGYYGTVAAQDPANIEALVATNVSAPIALTHALLPQLRAAAGRIVFISSVATALPTADYAVYTASKAALDGFANNLRLELGDAVRVQLLHPGATRTDMHRKIGITPEVMDTSKFTPPEVVAEQIAAAIAANSPQRALGFSNQVLRWAGIHAAGLIDGMMKRSASR